MADENASALKWGVWIDNPGRFLPVWQGSREQADEEASFLNSLHGEAMLCAAAPVTRELIQLADRLAAAFNQARLNGISASQHDGVQIVERYISRLDQRPE